MVSLKMMHTRAVVESDSLTLLHFQQNLTPRVKIVRDFSGMG